LLDEVFGADRIVETLAEGDVAELDAVKAWVWMSCAVDQSVNGCEQSGGSAFFLCRPQKCKKPNREGWAKCKIHNKILWLLDLGSNQGPTD
jgi:hypothetical protein